MLQMLKSLCVCILYSDRSFSRPVSFKAYRRVGGEKGVSALIGCSSFMSVNSLPEHAAGSCTSQCVVGPCSPLSVSEASELAGVTNPVTYLQINRILKQAHFQSLQSRSHLRDT
uniref:Uncharacterized protein n=1 Tax=Sparus aurata TaxID=8175 RepID=A0A671YVM5_SPAAU